MTREVKPFTYNRAAIHAGIVHIGVGNFHRAHQQYYTNKLLENIKDNRNWGICGIALLPTDQKFVEKLQEQDNEYTLTIYGRKGDVDVLKIGSLVELIWGYKDPEAALVKMASEEIKIISLTITEGGYNIDRSTGKFDLAHPHIASDLKNPTTPQSVFGFVAEALRRRKQSDNGPVTILSCDNLQHNGNTAKESFMTFFKKQDTELYEWALDNVTFPDSMVDRIVPAVTDEDAERINKENGTFDEAPVYCEDFTQWVIEDNFIAGRPNWDKVGAQFTDDVAVYENMKLSLLNASHTMLSYPAAIMGYKKVDEAMQDARLLKYIKNFMNKDATPYVPAPQGVDLEEYKETLIERFQNSAVSDQLVRLCFDGISKIPVYIMPNLEKMIADGADTKRLAFFVAAYRHYLRYQRDDKGKMLDVKEPWLTDKDIDLIKSNNEQDFLDLSPFNTTVLVMNADFVEKYREYCNAIEEKGIHAVLGTLN